MDNFVPLCMPPCGCCLVLYNHSHCAPMTRPHFALVRPLPYRPLNPGPERGPGRRFGHHDASPSSMFGQRGQRTALPRGIAWNLISRRGTSSGAVVQGPRGPGVQWSSGAWTGVWIGSSSAPNGMADPARCDCLGTPRQLAWDYWANSSAQQPSVQGGSHPSGPSSALVPSRPAPLVAAASSGHRMTAHPPLASALLI